MRRVDKPKGAGRLGDVDRLVTLKNGAPVLTEILQLLGAVTGAQRALATTQSGSEALENTPTTTVGTNSARTGGSAVLLGRRSVMRELERGGVRAILLIAPGSHMEAKDFFREVVIHAAARGVPVCCLKNEEVAFASGGDRHAEGKPGGLASATPTASVNATTSGPSPSGNSADACGGNITAAAKVEGLHTERAAGHNEVGAAKSAAPKKAGMAGSLMGLKALMRGGAASAGVKKPEKHAPKPTPSSTSSRPKREDGNAPGGTVAGGVGSLPRGVTQTTPGAAVSCQSTGASVVKRVSDHLAALCSQGTRAGGQPVGAEVRKKGKRNTYAPSNPVKTVTVVGIGSDGFQRMQEVARSGKGDALQAAIEGLGSLQKLVGVVEQNSCTRPGTRWPVVID